MSHNNQKKIATVNDLSGFGKCSVSVELPIISHMGVQCCPLITSIFSNHTGFESFYFDDYTDRMEEYISQWKKLELRFDGILSGFLGSQRQIEIIKRFIEDFKDEDTTVVIDPVMGDDGKPYPTYTDKMCLEMKHLVEYADIITPNITEACILTDTEYKKGSWNKEELFSLAEKLASMGAGKVVISGIESGQYLGNVIYEKGGQCKIFRNKKIGTTRSGTGDIFSAIIAADAVNKVSFEKSVKKASAFVKECISATENRNIPVTDGVCFEDVLYKLK